MFSSTNKRAMVPTIVIKVLTQNSSEQQNRLNILVARSPLFFFFFLFNHFLLYYVVRSNRKEEISYSSLIKSLYLPHGEKEIKTEDIVFDLLPNNPSTQLIRKVLHNRHVN